MLDFCCGLNFCKGSRLRYCRIHDIDACWELAVAWLSNSPDSTLVHEKSVQAFLDILGTAE